VNSSPADQAAIGEESGRRATGEVARAFMALCANHDTPARKRNVVSRGVSGAVLEARVEFVGVETFPPCVETEDPTSSFPGFRSATRARSSGCPVEPRPWLKGWIGELCRRGG